MIKFYNFLESLKIDVIEENEVLEEDLNKLLKIIYYAFKVNDINLLNKITEILALIDKDKQIKINTKKNYDFYHFNHIFLDKQTKRFFENKKNFLY